MTPLICKVQRLSLKDGTLIKENEEFEVDEKTAEQYIGGGIAVPAVSPPKTEETSESGKKRR